MVSLLKSVTVSFILISIVGCATNPSSFSEAYQIAHKYPKYKTYKRDLKKSEAESLFRLADISVDLENSEDIRNLAQYNATGRSLGDLGLEALINGLSGWSILAGNNTQGDDQRLKLALKGFGAYGGIIFQGTFSDRFDEQAIKEEYDRFVISMLDYMFRQNGVSDIRTSDINMKNSSIPRRYFIEPKEAFGTGEYYIGALYSEVFSEDNKSFILAGTEIQPIRSIVSIVTNSLNELNQKRSNALIDAFLATANGDTRYLLKLGSTSDIYLPPGILTADGIYHVPYTYDDGTSFDVPIELLLYKP